MATKLKAETAVKQVVRPQTRRASRLRSQARATIRSSHGDRAKALIRDVSVYGCALECQSGWIRSGMFLSIHLNAEWTVQAIVRWVREDRAGVEFLRPISEIEARAISED